MMLQRPNATHSGPAHAAEASYRPPSPGPPSIIPTAPSPSLKGYCWRKAVTACGVRRRNGSDSALDGALHAGA